MEPYENDLERFRADLLSSGVATPGTVVPCGGADIERLRRRHGPLPAAYEAFLRIAGRGAGSFWLGSDAFYPRLLDFDITDLQTLAAEMGVPLPAHDKLVIFSHQGYEFLWLDRSAGVNPSVWQLLEGAADQPRRLARTFTGLLLDNLNRCAAGG